jgi:aspartyl-tRNA(Asn)/glutamyl-tRNA(Gln) amidotransferase subunit B
MTTVATTYDELLAEWEPVVGLETHVELGTASKMFCGCAAAFGAEPNTQICPTCLGLPGSLPVVNAAAVELTVRIGLALNCSIAPWCRFARKNYFYPDMPKNFQTSQYDEPLCTDGWLGVDVDGVTHRVGIERVHMEEDTGTSRHVGSADGRITGASHSLLDYNRAGIPLVEIVTRPDVREATVARAYVTELREVLRSLGASEARMEHGQLRCDANVSVRRRGDTTLGTRTETKNVNSLRSVERAVRSEVERQVALVVAGGRIRQETRHFDETSGTTSPGRSKEEATDYRYFPEPDLVPLALDAAYVESVRESLPETPAQRRARLVTDFGYGELEVAQMSAAGVLDLVQETIAAGAEPAEARNYWMNQLTALGNERGVDPRDLGVSAADVARIVELVREGELTAKLAGVVLTAVADGEGAPDEVVEARGLRVVSDTGELQRLVDEAIAANADAADSVRAGRVAAAGQLVGAVMKASGGKADAKAVRELVLRILGTVGA